MSFITLDTKLNSFWTTLLDSKKQLFMSEKFLSSAAEDGEWFFVTLVFVLDILRSRKRRRDGKCPFTSFLVKGISIVSTSFHTVIPRWFAIVFQFCLAIVTFWNFLYLWPFLCSLQCHMRCFVQSRFWKLLIPKFVKTLM